MIRKLLGSISTMAIVGLAQANAPSCDKLESLKRSCEEVTSSSQMESPLKLYSAMLEELKKADASCPQFENTKKCAKRLNGRIANEGPARPYFKVSADTTLKNFGMDLIGAVVDSPAPTGKTRAPANAK